MTVTDKNTNVDAHAVRAAVDDIATTIAARAPEIEAARRVPGDLLDDLIRTGAFRMLRPVSHGGLGADLLLTCRTIETLARADASTAWVTAIGALAWCDLVGLPSATFDHIFESNPDAIVAGAFNPSGTITPDGDGYRVSGRWAFASGCEHADLIYGNCIEGFNDGMPMLRIAVFSPDQITIEDTWHVLGLCGTGSHHFHVDDAYVAADRTCAPMADEPCLDDPVARVPLPSMIALCIGSVALGIAQGALDDITALAPEKVPMLGNGPLADDPIFQLELATADTSLRAARSLLHETAESLWSRATESAPFTLHDCALARSSAVWAARQASATVDAAYRCGGSSSIFSGSPLQRRLRDIHTLTQHFLLRDNTLGTAGAIMAGRDPQVPVF